MKEVTLKELRELVPNDSNYMFLCACESDPEDGDRVYEKAVFEDIVANFIACNGGDVESCLSSRINHYDSEGNLLESYCLKPTAAEQAELIKDCAEYELYDFGL